MDTIWLVVKDKKTQESVATFLRENLPDLMVEPIKNGPVLWVKVSGNGRVNGLRFLLKNVQVT